MTDQYHELERAWLARLNLEWASLNQSRVKGRLRPPVLALHRGGEKLGLWDPGTRTLTISATHIREHAWEDVLETLKHEMAHQYVSEVMGITDGLPHGEAFSRACGLLGVSPRASAHQSRLQNEETDRIFAKIKKLLALADRADVHEAALAMATANTLLLRYNLDLSQTSGRAQYVVRRLGEPVRNIPVVSKLIGAILTEYFFVEGIWVPSYDARRNVEGRVFEIMGTVANVEMAHYVYDFLLRECNSLWAEARRSLKLTGARGKREYMTGVLLGFRDRLRSERYVNTERGLVWIKDASLNEFFGNRYPRTRAMHRGAVRKSDALDAGTQAGKQITLRRGVHEGPSGNSPKLLER